MAVVQMPPPRGFWRFVWSILESPRTPTVLLLWIGVAAIIGLAAPYGNHPAEGVLVHLPAALLPFALLARAGRGPAGLVRRAWAVGFAVALVGAALSGGGSGQVRLDFTQPVEAYARLRGASTVPAYLGSPVAAAMTPEGDLALRLGIGGSVLGEAVLPVAPPAERPLGPWAVHVNRTEPGTQATVAHLRVKVRGAEGAGAPLEARLGRELPLPPGAGGKTGTLGVLALEGAVGGGNGAAARLALKWDDGNATDWYYVDAPTLDARSGTSPWSISVVELVADPAIVLGVRRRGPDAVALVGWAIMALSLLAGLALGGSPATKEDA